ncbi:MAG: hypothetical protein H0W88_06365 [Parachlamydiaceae bacterium]|nr:hypothetical protein [Parachlamydiaceae bacterium]
MMNVSNQSTVNKIIPTIKTQWDNFTPLQKNVIIVAIAFFTLIAWTKTFYYIFNIFKSDCSQDESKTNKVFKKILTTEIGDLAATPKELLAPITSDKKIESLEITPKTALKPIAVKSKEVLEPIKSVNEPKDQSPKQVEPKVESPKVEAPKVEAPKVEAPKAGVKKTQLPDGSIVEGEVKAGLLQGQGKMTLKSGEVYEGMFKDGKLHGKGKSTIDGFLIEGNFLEGQLHGKGKVIESHSNHLHEEGMYIKGELINGTAIIRQDDSYTGTFFKGQLFGPGSKILSGDRYEGNFKASKLFGEGKIIKLDKSIIEGIFKDDVKVEAQTSVSEYMSYCGEWKDKQRNGMGIRKGTAILQGFFKDGEILEGTWTESDKTTFIGKFIAGRLNGLGLMLTPGERWEGNFLNDELDGLGRIIFDNGDLIEGHFIDGELSGPGIYTTLAGKVSNVTDTKLLTTTS